MSRRNRELRLVGASCLLLALLQLMHLFARLVQFGTKLRHLGLDNLERIDKVEYRVSELAHRQDVALDRWHGNQPTTFSFNGADSAPCEAADRSHESSPLPSGPGAGITGVTRDLTVQETADTSSPGVGAASEAVPRSAASEAPSVVDVATAAHLHAQAELLLVQAEVLRARSLSGAQRPAGFQLEV